MHESHKGSLIFTVGSSRSGKSTYANNWVREMGFDSQGLNGNPRVVVDSDYIRQAIHGERYIRKAEPFVFATKWIMIRALLSSGFDVLCDDSRTTKQSLKELFEIDPNAQFIFIDTPAKTCIERAVATGQQDLIPVIQRMWKNIYNLANYGDNGDFWNSNTDTPINRIQCNFNFRVNIGIEKIRQEVKDMKNG